MSGKLTSNDMSKNDISKNLPITDHITIEIAGQSYQVKTPFTFEFWIWFIENFVITDPSRVIITDKKTEIKVDENADDNVSNNIHKIIARLIGLDSDSVLEKQTESEEMKAQSDIIKQFLWERERRPFVTNKAMMRVIQIMIRRQIGGKS